jgi:hypothetical protein
LYPILAGTSTQGHKSNRLFQFVAPCRSRVAQGLYDELERPFREQVHAFVGAAFEELCDTWTLVQASVAGLPFSPEFVGSD